MEEEKRDERDEEGETAEAALLLLLLIWLEAVEELVKLDADDVLEGVTWLSRREMTAGRPESDGFVACD